MASTFYQKKNNALTTITNNPLAAAGLSITLATGTGSLFPTTGATWLATIWDNDTYPSNPTGDPNMEIVLIDSRSTDTLTVNASGRGFGGTADVEHATGSTIALLIMVEHLSQYETAINALEALFDTSTGHDHDGSDSKLLFTGATLTKKASVAISQAQSLVATQITVSGIADEDAGTIDVICGGNVGAVDRASQHYTFSYYKTGGTVNFSTGVTSQTTGGGTAAHIVITAVNSSGDALIKLTTGAFGAGNFIGNLLAIVTKNTTGLILTP